jgi:hypothetical protein
VVKREAVEKRRKKVERKRELDEAIYWDRETLFSYLGKRGKVTTLEPATVVAIRVNARSTRMP